MLLGEVLVIIVVLTMLIAPFQLMGAIISIFGPFIAMVLAITMPLLVIGFLIGWLFSKKKGDKK